MPLESLTFCFTLVPRAAQLCSCRQLQPPVVHVTPTPSTQNCSSVTQAEVWGGTGLPASSTYSLLCVSLPKSQPVHWGRSAQ